MRWPFLLRSTHERLVREAVEHSARNNAAGVAAAKAYHASVAQHAVVRAEAAEAQLKQLALPVLEVTRRFSELEIMSLIPRPDAAKMKVVVRLSFNGEVVPAFYGHARVLGYAMRDLVVNAMSLLQREERDAAAIPKAKP